MKLLNKESKYYFVTNILIIFKLTFSIKFQSHNMYIIHQKFILKLLKIILYDF